MPLVLSYTGYQQFYGESRSLLRYTIIVVANMRWKLYLEHECFPVDILLRRKPPTVMKNKSIIKGVITILIYMLCAIPVYPADNAEKESTFEKAQKYYFQRKFEMAELLLQQALKENPENEKAYSYLGDIFLNKKRYDGALNLYQRALDMNPENGENLFRVGQIYYYKKEGQKAVEYFKRAFAADPSLKYSYYHVGLASLMLLRDKQKTINAWEQFLSIAPEDPQYEKIRRVIELLKDPNFKIPPPGSDISIEEALHLGGATLSQQDRKTEDRKAGHEKKKTKQKFEEIYRDDDL